MRCEAPWMQDTHEGAGSTQVGKEQGVTRCNAAAGQGGRGVSVECKHG
jgi:hypothetical protein